MQEHTRRKFIGGAVGSGVALAYASGRLGGGVAAANGAPTQIGTPDPVLDGYLQQQMQDGQIPGLAAAVVVGDDIAWGRALGYADQLQQTPMTLYSSQAIASVTKTVSATLVLRAVRAGQLDLDDPLETVLPFLVRNPNHATTPITLRQLLTHTSSLVDYGDGDPYGTSYRLTGPHSTISDEWAQLYYGVDGELYDADSGFFLEDAPGDVYEYANGPWSLAAAAVREATGLAFPGWFRTRVAGPLGLVNSSFRPSDITWTSTQHALLDDGEKVPDSGFGLYSNLFAYPRTGALRQPLAGYTGYIPYGRYSYPALPDGGLYSNAHDVARYLAMWMNGGALDGNRVLTQALVTEALSPQLPPAMDQPGGLGGEGYRQCITWTEDLSEPGTYWHEGEDLGTRTVAAFSVPTGVGVVVIANVESVAPFDMNAVMARLLADFGGPDFQ